MESLINLMSKANKATMGVYEKEHSKAEIKYENNSETKADLEAKQNPD